MVPIEPDGSPGTVSEVTTIGGAPDGLTVDACGHLYVVDQQNSRLYRIRLTTGGNAVGTPTLLADFPTGVTNAQFGRGPGFSETATYASGNSGTVYRLEIGVPGAPYP